MRKILKGAERNARVSQLGELSGRREPAPCRRVATDPSLWDAIRYRVDHGDGPGRYILTGPSVPPETDEMEHSGAGRFSWIRMRPMSLWESCESSGEVSLGSLFSGEDPTGAVAKGDDGGIPSARPFSVWYTIDIHRHGTDAESTQ